MQNLLPNLSQPHKNVQLIQKNAKNDFIGIYYNLTEGESKLSCNSTSNEMGLWSYNLSVIEGASEFKHSIKAGSKSFTLYIFIKKKILNSYAQKDPSFRRKIAEIINPKKDTFVKWDRMSNQSLQNLIDLRKLKVGGVLFNLNLTATVHLLLSDYLLKLSDKEIENRMIHPTDWASIVSAQKFLVDNIENPFPSNKFIAERFNMSESKFKDLFKQITDISPNTFFMDNKLQRAKELLEDKQLSITQVSEKLNFTNNSYFALMFKTKFGVPPKIFIRQL